MVFFLSVLPVTEKLPHKPPVPHLQRKTISRLTPLTWSLFLFPINFFSGIVRWVPDPHFQPIITFLPYQSFLIPNIDCEKSIDDTDIDACDTRSSYATIALQVLPKPLPRLALKPLTIQPELREELQNEESFPTEFLVKENIGNFALMHPRTYYALPHSTSPLLLNYAKHGWPVDCDTNWSFNKIKLHKCALTKAAIHFLRHETKEKVKHGYTHIIT